MHRFINRALRPTKLPLRSLTVFNAPLEKTQQRLIEEAKDSYKTMCHAGASFEEKDVMTQYIQNLSEAKSFAALSSLRSPALHRQLNEWSSKELPCDAIDLDEISDKYGLR